MREGARRYGMVRLSGSIKCRYDTGRYGAIRYGKERYGTMRNDTERYGTVRYGTILNEAGMVRYGTRR